MVLNAVANNYIFVCTVHVLSLQHFGNRLYSALRGYCNLGAG